jgi:hypothetical protein
MVIVALLYAILVWLLFFKLRWPRWGWGTGTFTVILGALLCAVFVGCLSYLAPTGRVTVISRVVEVAPLDMIGWLLLYGRALTLYL